MKELWRAVSGYENVYDVSNHGRVRSLDRISRNRYGPVKKKGQMLKPYLDPSGYKTVDLRYNGRRSSRSVHRLVAFAFVDGYEEGYQVNHISGVKTENHHSNLEWCTQLENTRHAIRTGLKGPLPKGVASASFKGAVVASPLDSSGVGLVMFGSLQIKSAGFSPNLISVCISRKRGSHKGCTFERVEK